MKLTFMFIYCLCLYLLLLNERSWSTDFRAAGNQVRGWGSRSAEDTRDNENLLGVKALITGI
ncbi:hypothetical protein JOB18_025465 [Solea senegalensis]|uniref:Uncharacterized protein n=1 Tax=Solea senegalensis TaxID=28829 RepID=A0AAV6R7S5_SOLSE|nr:hypothetical protein JOB18_025465 [Solea senegalensis]